MRNPHALNTLLQVWPRDGARTNAEFRRLDKLTRALGVSVDPGVSRGQLRKAASNLAHRNAAVPWKYQKYLRPNQNIRQEAIKVQPGATIPVTFNGQETTMYVEKVRRTPFRGKPWYVQMTVKLNTEHLPLVIPQQSKCDCLFCGSSTISDESACRNCGAPLPDC